MNIKNIIAVSGEPGFFKLVSSKNNGLILSNLDSGRSSFFSVRSHQFTPLETVGIYTMVDTIDLKDVFERMRKMEQIPEANRKTSDRELMTFFEEIIPDYDRDKVYSKDVKKVIKWFRKLEEHGLLDAIPEEDDSEE